jgi:hypothetical protein
MTIQGIAVPIGRSIISRLPNFPSTMTGKSYLKTRFIEKYNKAAYKN